LGAFDDDMEEEGTRTFAIVMVLETYSRSEGTEGRQTGDETSHLTVGRSIAHYLPDNDWQILFLERKLEVCWGRELLLVVEEALVGRFEKFIH
jgi:hypothetical protein